MMIRSSSHSTKFANVGKQEMLRNFLQEYTRVKWELVDYLWNTRIIWGNRTSVLDIQHNQLNCPKYISHKAIPIKTNLSARAVKSISDEALGIISSAISKRYAQLYILKKLQRSGDIEGVRKLQSKIDSHPLIKSTNKKNSIWANLDSNCCEFIPYKNSFDGFLKLFCLGKDYGHIYIPIRFTKNSNKFRNAGFDLKTSWHIGIDQICSCWEKKIPASFGTKIIGGDQGATTCLSLSDGQVTGKDIHGHDLASIMQKMNRKKKGSKAFARAQEERTNYINWAIKRLDLTDVSEFRLEKLFQMRKGSNTSSFLSRWTYTQINSAVENLCEVNGVRLVEQSATYRSQRCSGCGWVQKANRKGKEFHCHSCGLCMDADVNGACNHVADLDPLPFCFSRLHLNKAGFFWKEDGLFDATGQALPVPDEYKTRSI